VREDEHEVCDDGVGLGVDVGAEISEVAVFKESCGTLV